MYKCHALCFCSYKKKLSPQSDISLIWDQAGDTDVISLHLVNVTAKVSPHRKKMIEAGSFVQRKIIAVTCSDIKHE